MACRALLRRKTTYYFRGQSAAVLIPTPAPAPRLLRPYSSTPFTSSCHNNLPSLLVATKSHSVFIRQLSTSTHDVATDSDNDLNGHWVSIANGATPTKSQNFVLKGLHAAWTNTLHICRFLISAPFMSRLEWVRWREHMGLYVSFLLATCRFNITYLRAHVSITGRLLLKLCRGESLSTKERKLLSRTTAELFRISPRATNIVLPSLEFMLPHFHTLFRILPSPLVRKLKQQEAARRKLKARIEYGSFLEDTATEMALVAQNSESGGIQQTAEDYARFASRCTQGKLVSNEKILRYSKLFNDETTLEYLSRSRLMNMCKHMGITPYGSDNFLRFMLRERLESIKKGDELVQEKGVESLLEAELHKACRERGIHAGEEMRQQLRDWLDLSVCHSIPSSLLILSRDYIVPGKKPEELLLDVFCSLPYDLVHIVGATHLPTKDRSMNKFMKLESLDLQEKLIKEEERELLELKQSDIRTTLDLANGASGAQLCDILASALSLKMECEKFVKLVNEEIYLCNRVEEKEGADVGKEDVNTQRGGRGKNNQNGEVYVNVQVSSLLRNRADAMFRKIDNVDAKVDERWRDLERYCDGKVNLEEVAAAALYLKDAFDEGIQDLICNHSKYKEEIMKLSTEAEDVKPREVNNS